MAPKNTIEASERELYRAYYDDPTLSDLTIKLADRKVQVHRIVLCRGSEYFTSLIMGRFRESESKEVELHGDNPQAMSVMLRYIYRLPYSRDDTTAGGGFQLLEHHALVFVVAEKYQIHGLQIDACKIMKDIINANTYSFWSFRNAIRTIFSATMQHSIARVLMIETCISDLRALKQLTSS